MRDDERAARDRLIRLGGTELANELAAIYLDEMPLRMSAARAAVRERDCAALAEASHGMKSSSAQLGAGNLAVACEEVENAAAQGDIARAADWFSSVEAEYASFASWLSERTSADARSINMSANNEVPRADAERAIVAVIEDNADNRLLLHAILGDDFVIHAYEGGSEALAAMPDRLPDLVLLDVSLPGMDGLEVLAAMRTDPALREVPVVAVTAHAMTGDRERYLSCGFDGYVSKPIVDESVLIDAVNMLLARRRGSSGGR